MLSEVEVAVDVTHKQARLGVPFNTTAVFVHVPCEAQVFPSFGLIWKPRGDRRSTNKHRDSECTTKNEVRIKQMTINYDKLIYERMLHTNMKERRVNMT